MIETLREITINNMAGRKNWGERREGIFVCVVWNFSIGKPSLSLRPFIRSCLGGSGRGIASNGILIEVEGIK